MTNQEILKKTFTDGFFNEREIGLFNKALDIARKDEAESVMVWAVNHGFRFDNVNLKWTNGKTTFNFEQLYTTYQSFIFFKC